MVCVAKSTAAFLLFEGRLRKEAGAVQRCAESRARHHHPADTRAAVHHRNVDESNFHLCKTTHSSAGLSAPTLLSSCVAAMR